MNNSPHNISRRSFFKVALAGIGAIFLTAFRNVTGHKGSTSASSTPVPSPTLDPALAKLPKFKPLPPLQASALKAVGRVSFTWVAIPIRWPALPAGWRRLSMGACQQTSLKRY